MTQHEQADVDARLAVRQRIIDQQNERLVSIAALARQYNHAGVQPDLHAAMNRVLDLATGERRDFQ
jgi:hypothetical protein